MRRKKQKENKRISLAEQRKDFIRLFGNELCKLTAKKLDILNDLENVSKDKRPDMIKETKQLDKIIAELRFLQKECEEHNYTEDYSILPGYTIHTTSFVSDNDCYYLIKQVKPLRRPQALIKKKIVKSMQTVAEELNKQVLLAINNELASYGIDEIETPEVLYDGGDDDDSINF